MFRHKTGFSCFYGKLHKRKSHDVWHHCHVYRHLHNVTQSLPFGKILRIMETESKQSCVLVYRYTKGITIVLPFFRSLCLAVLYCWVFCIGSSARRRPTTGPAGGHGTGRPRGHIPTRPDVDVFAASLKFKNAFFIQNSRIQ